MPRLTHAIRPLRRRLAIGMTALAVASALTGCAGTVPMAAAPDAKNRECADVVVRLPDTVAGLAKRDTDAQATGAWGAPASVLLRCGVPSPGPTTDRCVSVNGVDWVIDEKAAPHYLFTTFGRTPAVEVLVDNSKVSGTSAISDLSGAVAAIPATGKCTTLSSAQ